VAEPGDGSPLFEGAAAAVAAGRGGSRGRRRGGGKSEILTLLESRPKWPATYQGPR
jgi:hypothetical protein